MKIINSKLATPNSKHRAAVAGLDLDRNIPLAVGAELLGVSVDSIRRREAPRGVETLTIIDAAREGAQRRLLQLRLSEVIALRDKLYEDARERMNVERMLDAKRRREHFTVLVNE